MATTFTYSRFELSPEDQMTFMGYLNLLAASTVSVADQVQQLTTDTLLFWNGANTLAFLAPVYNALIDETGIMSYVLYGIDCHTDSTVANAAYPPAANGKNYKYCAFTYAQLWKAGFLSAAVATWLGLTVGVGTIEYFYKSIIESTEGGY